MERPGPAARPAARLVAVMITDVVGSTELQTRLGDRLARDQLARHDETVRMVVGGHDGRVVKGLGDGFLSVFPSAQESLLAAADIQRRISGEGETVSVRIGLHSGEVIDEDDDVHGAAVAAAARICALARGGEILASDVLVRMAGRTPGVEVADRGSFRLKGFPEPVAVLEVVWRDEPPPESRVVRPSSALVGRRREIAELSQLVDEAASGRGQLVLIVGEPGIGKTRLAEHVASLAEASGFAEAWGRCWEGEAPAFWPWVQVLGRLAPALRDRGYRLPAGAARARLVKMVPELDGSVADEDDIGETDRVVLFEAVASILRAAAERQPLLVVVDDLQWSDPGSAALLSYLAPDLRVAPVLVVATVRLGEGQQEVVDAVLALRRHAVTIELGGLSAAEVEELVRQILGASPAGFAEELAVRSGGNPFFVREAARLVVAGGGTAVPGSVRQILDQRLERLTARSRAALDAAAVAGTRFAFDVVRAVGEWPSGELLEALDDAERAGLVRAESTPGSYRFVHDLTRETIYAELGSRRRAELHARVGETLEGRRGRADELAHHFSRAAPLGTTDKAIGYAERAGREALEQLAFEDAALHFQRALELSDSTEDSTGRPPRSRLLLALSEAERRAGRASAAVATSEEALRDARAGGDPRSFAEAALAHQEAVWSVSVSTPDAAASERSLLLRALEGLGEEDVELRGLLLARLPRVCEVIETAEQKLRWARLAEAASRRHPSPRLRLAAAEAMAYAASGPRHTLARLHAASLFAEEAERQGNLARAADARLFLVSANGELGRATAMEREIELVARQAARAREPLWLSAAASHRAFLAVLRGRFDQGEELASEALSIGQAAGLETAFLAYVYGVQVVEMRWHQGRLREMVDMVRAAAASTPRVFVRCGLAATLARTGFDEEAQSVLDGLALEGWPDLVEDDFYLSCLVVLAEAASALADERAARLLEPLITPWADRLAVLQPGIACWGPLARSLGQVMVTMGRADDAGEQFARAVTASRSLRAPAWEAHSEIEWAHACELDGNRSGAVEHAAKARAIGERLGMAEVAARAAELLSAPGRSRRRRTTTPGRPDA